MGAAAQLQVTGSDPVGLWSRYFAPSQPDRPSPSWHVSPVIDMAAYHFSWAWVLIPMTLFTPYSVFLNLYAVMMGANFAHRHYGLPYAYLDGENFRSFERQLTWLPVACIALMLATPFLAGKHAIHPVTAQAVGAVVFFSLLWNFWHTYMQKFGILRLYEAKQSGPVSLKVPPLVDKYFLFCWFPLYFSYLGPLYKDLILLNGSSVSRYTKIIIGFFEAHQRWFLTPSIFIAAGGVGLWLWWEWRAHRFRNRARLSAGAGTLLISTALFWANPVKAFIAFAFSHAVEYMVFVWAFQRRFYFRPRPIPSPMQGLLRHPVSWYLSFTAILTILGTVQVLWGKTIMHGVKSIAFLGLTGNQWFFYYAVYESLVHFHMDGFLWKMRRPEVRKYI